MKMVLDESGFGCKWSLMKVIFDECCFDETFLYEK